MEKIFKSIEELLDFDFSQLTPQSSNYLLIIPPNGETLPKVRKEHEPNRWKIVERHGDSDPGIVFEITPRWMTITIHRKTGFTRRKDFPILGKNPKDVILDIFE